MIDVSQQFEIQAIFRAKSFVRVNRVHADAQNSRRSASGIDRGRSETHELRWCNLETYPSGRNTGLPTGRGNRGDLTGVPSCELSVKSGALTPTAGMSSAARTVE